MPKQAGYTISNEYPPNYEEIKKAFNLVKGVVFTYGNTIYNPDNIKINKLLLEHEKVHIRQQGTNPEEWWKRYLIDKDFVLAVMSNSKMPSSFITLICYE